jgi:hypothetical protein
MSLTTVLLQIQVFWDMTLCHWMSGSYKPATQKVTPHKTQILNIIAVKTSDLTQVYGTHHAQFLKSSSFFD